MRVHHRARRSLSPQDTNKVHNYDNRLVNKLKFRNVKFNKDHTEVHVKLHRASDFNADVQNYIKSKANENGAQLRLITKEKIPSVANSATILDGNKFKTITKRKLDTANKRVDVIDGGQFKTITEQKGKHTTTTLQLPLENAVRVLTKLAAKDMCSEKIPFDITQFTLPELETLRELIPAATFVDDVNRAVLLPHGSDSKEEYKDYIKLSSFYSKISLKFPPAILQSSASPDTLFGLEFLSDSNTLNLIELTPNSFGEHKERLLSALKPLFHNNSLQMTDCNHQVFNIQGEQQDISDEVLSTYQYTLQCNRLKAPQLSPRTIKINEDSPGKCEILVEGSFTLTAAEAADELCDITKRELQSILAYASTDNASLKIIRTEKKKNAVTPQKKRGLRKNRDVQNTQPQSIEKELSLKEVKKVIEKAGYNNIDEDKHLISLNIKEFNLHELQILHDLMPSFDLQDRKHNLLVPYKRLPPNESKLSMCNLHLFERLEAFPNLRTHLITLPGGRGIDLLPQRDGKTILLSPANANLSSEEIRKASPDIAAVKRVFSQYTLISTDPKLQKLLEQLGNIDAVSKKKPPTKVDAHSSNNADTPKSPKSKEQKTTYPAGTKKKTKPSKKLSTAAPIGVPLPSKYETSPAMLKQRPMADAQEAQVSLNRTAAFRKIPMMENTQNTQVYLKTRF